MAENDVRGASARDAAFVARSQLLTSEEVSRSLRRIAHEILEHTNDVADLVIVGLQTGGVAFASHLASDLSAITGQSVRSGQLDVAFYRDDLARNPTPTLSSTVMEHDLTDRVVVVVDDVLYTGRTVRAALNALSDWGRPRAVRLAVMVDRGHRELPIRPDFVGKNLPTSSDEAIVATLEGVWIGTKGPS